MRHELPTITVTLLFTDVEGSTGLLNELVAEVYEEALAESCEPFCGATRNRVLVP